jgi:organic hydroperoxide reductase OsmC/OhrA
MNIAPSLKHEYSLSLDWDETVHRGLISSGERIPLAFSPPAEFGGTGKVWSPEHLLAASLSSCYTTTLFYFARLLKLDIANYHLDIKMEIEKEGCQPFTATKFFLCPAIVLGVLPPATVVDNLLSKAKRYCIISNSVKGEIIVEPKITCV